VSDIYGCERSEHSQFSEAELAPHQPGVTAMEFEYVLEKDGKKIAGEKGEKELEKLVKEIDSEIVKQK